MRILSKNLETPQESIDDILDIQELSQGEFSCPNNIFEVPSDATKSVSITQGNKLTGSETMTTEFFLTKT